MSNSAINQPSNLPDVVVGGTVGSTTLIPVLTINTEGIITAMSQVSPIGNASGYVNASDVSAVGFSGKFSDLLNVPTMFSGSYNDLTNRPTIFSGVYSDLTGRPSPSINGLPFVTKTSDFIANPGNNYWVDATNGQVNVTMPTSNNLGDTAILIKKIDSSSNGVSISGKFNGSSSNSTISLVLRDASKTFSAGGSGIYNVTSGDFSMSSFDSRYAKTISITTTGTTGAATYNSTTGVLNIPNYTPASTAGFVDTTTTQSIGGAKTFTNPLTVAGPAYITADLTVGDQTGVNNQRIWAFSGPNGVAGKRGYVYADYHNVYIGTEDTGGVVLDNAYSEAKAVAVQEQGSPYQSAKWWVDGASGTATGVWVTSPASAPNYNIRLGSATGQLLIKDNNSNTVASVSGTGAGVLSSLSLANALPISSGGTGSVTKNFIDLTTAQTVAGVKTFNNNISLPNNNQQLGGTAAYLNFRTDNSGMIEFNGSYADFYGSYARFFNATLQLNQGGFVGNGKDWYMFSNSATSTNTTYNSGSVYLNARYWNTSTTSSRDANLRMYYIMSSASNTSPSGRVAFVFGDAESYSNIEAMSILNTGNIGIGITAPTQKLHVNGNIIISGDVMLPTGRLNLSNQTSNVYEYIYSPAGTGNIYYGARNDIVMLADNDNNGTGAFYWKIGDNTSDNTTKVLASLNHSGLFNTTSGYTVSMLATTASTPTTSTTGGSLAAATYYYKVVGLDPTGATSASSAEVSIATTGTTSSNTITWTGNGATSYRVYRGTSAGNESVYYTVNALTFTDTGATNTAGAVPTINLATIVRISNGVSYFNAPANNGSIVTRQITVQPNFTRSTSASIFLDNTVGQIWEFFNSSSGTFGVYDGTNYKQPFQIQANAIGGAFGINVGANSMAQPLNMNNNNIIASTMPYSVVGGNTTTNPNLKIIEVTANYGVTLQTAVSISGLDFYIINAYTAAITVTAQTGQTIGNTASAANTYSVPSGTTLHVVSNGSNWRTL